MNAIQSHYGKLVRRLKNALLVIVILVVTFFAAGCMQVALTGSQSNNGPGNLTKEELNKYPKNGSATIYGCFYSKKPWTEWNREKAIKGIGLYDVRIHTNMLFMLTGVFTLGIVVPEGVEWELQDIHPRDTGEEEWNGDANQDTKKGKE